jgi:hypothetical protein
MTILTEQSWNLVDQQVLEALEVADDEQVEEVLSELQLMSLLLERKAAQGFACFGCSPDSHQ